MNVLLALLGFDDRSFSGVAQNKHSFASTEC
jgi:hypothetical protein